MSLNVLPGVSLTQTMTALSDAIEEGARLSYSPQLQGVVEWAYRQLEAGADFDAQKGARREGARFMRAVVIYRAAFSEKVQDPKFEHLVWTVEQAVRDYFPEAELWKGKAELLKEERWEATFEQVQYKQRPTKAVWTRDPPPPLTPYEKIMQAPPPKWRRVLSMLFDGLIDFFTSSWRKKAKE